MGASFTQVLFASTHKLTSGFVHLCVRRLLYKHIIKPFFLSHNLPGLTLR